MAVTGCQTGCQHGSDFVGWMLCSGFLDPRCAFGMVSVSKQNIQSWRCVFLCHKYSLLITPRLYSVYHINLMFLELAVLALARIMCADIHSQNGTVILARLLNGVKYSLDVCRHESICKL